ncbi:PH domain-containing protein [Isoptericola sp. b441]|uniref:PH domain-containing protein n=1 Tax=Actinotalea lenta TaxID=3064654 RepID=A0ABT9DB23_9CELL|nr:MULTISPECIES: PH domain-containing protein [unclassified Isoptericola]MDO8107348.1 PH domain-containing protein [Isoptericola sp. b441]MDO8120989.1 PH domain-containing protein [Isoptericola sp. b490]
MVKESMLARGEKVIFTAHAHWKNLVVPVLVTLLALAVLLLALLVWLPDPATQAWQRWTVAVLATALAVAFGLWPALAWFASTDTLTTRRLISRRGVLSREGREIPIERVQSVTYRRTLLERMLGCGTLIVQTAGETSDVELTDVAHLERRILQVQELLLREEIPAEGNPPVSDEAGTDGGDDTGRDAP